MKNKLQHIRDMLYQVNAVNISMYMLGMKKRDDKLVADTNECLGEILKQLDELIQETKQGMVVESVNVHQNVNIPLDARNANARLMAAAPELLGALQEIIVAADGEGWSPLDAGFTKARAAVAKALGND